MMDESVVINYSMLWTAMGERRGQRVFDSLAEEVNALLALVDSEDGWLSSEKAKDGKPGDC